MQQLLYGFKLALEVFYYLKFSAIVIAGLCIYLYKNVTHLWRQLFKVTNIWIFAQSKH